MADGAGPDQFNYPAPETLSEPFDFYRAMRNEAPVYKVPDADVFIVSRYEDMTYAGQHPEIFSSKRVWMASDDPQVAAIRAKGYPDSNSLTATDPPAHTGFRMLAIKVFSPRRFASLEPNVRELADSLVDGFIGDGRADLQAQFATPLPLIVIADLLGLPREEMATFKRWSDDYSEAIASNSRPLPRERVLECAQSLTDLQLYFSKVIEQRRASPGEDAISELVRINDASPTPASHVELVDMLRIFMIGGNETAVDAIGSMMFRLLKQPQLWAAVKADPALVPKVVEESLRFDSPTQWSGRTATQDTSIAGVDIPQGSRVYLMWGSGNRDKERFGENSEGFDPVGNKASGHLAFGFGAHFCAGAALGRMEMAMALRILSARLENLRLADPDVHFHPHPILRGINHLFVEFDPA